MNPHDNDSQDSLASEGVHGEWKCGNEYLPYHPSASDVEPAYRDGWNACYRAALATPVSAPEAPTAPVAAEPGGASSVPIKDSYTFDEVCTIESESFLRGRAVGAKYAALVTPVAAVEPSDINRWQWSDEGMTLNNACGTWVMYTDILAAPAAAAEFNQSRGQWEGKPLADYPELRKALAEGLANGTLEIGGATPVAAATVRDALVVNMVRFSSLTKHQARAIVAFAFDGAEPDKELFATPVAAAEPTIRRVISELRWYNPAADTYKGAHIHGVWARELEAALATPVAAAEPSDEELRALMPPKSGMAPSNVEAARRGLVGAFRDVWTEPAMLDYARRILALRTAGTHTGTEEAK